MTGLSSMQERIEGGEGPPSRDGPASGEFSETFTRARVMGSKSDWRAELELDVEHQLEAYKERQAARDAWNRVICGAKTRKGTPCRLKSEPGRKRCKFHGGKSTGPRTPEGKARISEAQRKRWAAHRERRATA